MHTSKLHIWFPLVLMGGVIGAVGYLTYAAPKGPFYQVVYLNQDANAMVESAAFADAIVASNQNVATIYLKEKKNDVLERSGAILLDPKGVPLCLTSTSSAQTIPAF